MRCELTHTVQEDGHSTAKLGLSIIFVVGTPTDPVASTGKILLCPNQPNNLGKHLV